MAHPKHAFQQVINADNSACGDSALSGKALLALSLGIAISNGMTALNRYKTTQGKVLFLALEDGFRRLQNRLSKLTQDSGAAISENLLLSCDIPRLDKGGLEVIEKWIEDNPDARLIVVDTRGPFDAEADKHSTAYASDTRSLAPLQKLAFTKQIAVLLITHLTKRSSDDPLARVMGSTGVIGVADAVWLLERERSSPQGVLSVTGRDVIEQKLAIDFNDGHWAILGDAARYQLSEERLAIREYLEQSNTPAGVREIASAINKRESAVKSLLYKMLKDAQIRKTKRGLYSAADINEVFADV